MKIIDFSNPSMQPSSCAPVQALKARFVCCRLRVVREADPAISPDCAGRMVISGRMADVCAELDRMALRATAAR
ncbi:MAG: hypothetical protein JWP96_2324 [Polaromonas sp.]|nr:hypothetical protein [Polaromonas sp.]